MKRGTYCYTGIGANPSKTDYTESELHGILQKNWSRQCKELKRKSAYSPCRQQELVGKAHTALQLKRYEETMKHLMEVHKLLKDACDKCKAPVKPCNFKDLVDFAGAERGSCKPKVSRRSRQ
jgi:hypothetical protein